MSNFRFLAVFPFILWSGLAQADATNDGAANLAGLLQTYLGATEGVVTVAPENAAYNVKIDLAPLISKMRQPGLDAHVTPLELLVTDNGDGTWSVTQDQAIELAVSVPDTMDYTMSAAHFVSNGIFDESLHSFSSFTADLTDVSNVQTIRDPTIDEINSASHADTIHIESTASAGAAGGVDTTSTYDVAGYSQTMGLPMMGEVQDVTVTARSYTAKVDMQGFRPDAFYRLLAFLVANPSAEAITGKQHDLKEILRAGVPFFDHMISNAAVGSVVADTPMGTIRLDQIQATVEANGIVANGQVREAVTLSGLRLPVELVPAWAIDLVPQSLVLDLGASGFDLAGPATLLLNNLDLTADPPLPEGVDQALLALLLPKGAAEVTLGASSVKGPVYEAKFAGSMSVGPNDIPTGTARITATGLDKVEAAFAAAPPSLGMQGSIATGMLVAMAKPGADGELVWDIDATQPGVILVNGVDVLGMGAAP